MPNGVISRKFFKEILGVKFSAQVNQEAERFGFELEPNGDVNLANAYKALRQVYLDSVDGDQDLKGEKLKEEIEKLRHHNFEKRIGNEVLAGNRIEVEKVKPLLDFVSSSIREAGDLVARKSNLTGTECQSIINACVDKLETEIDRTFGRLKPG